MSYTTLFFDVDDTLYASSCGVWQIIRNRMGQYMSERLGMPPEEVPVLRRRYFETYGTTLRGLQFHHQVDTDDYLEYVHNLPLDQYIQPNPGLRRLLLSLPQSRWVFTNADAHHAGRVLSVLGLEGCFDGVIDIRAVEFACKPEEAAFRRALAITGNPNPASCVLFDDSAVNLSGARQVGIKTVLVGANDASNQHASEEALRSADLSIPDLLALPEHMPELWNSHA